MWKEVSDNLVWQTDSFFSDETLMNLKSLLNQEDSSIIKSNRDKPVFAESEFHYHLLKSELEKNSQILSEVSSNLNCLFRDLNEPLFPAPPFKISQAMIKYFSPGSNYELHTEDRDSFGPWVYIIYLSTEQSSPIQFLSETSALALPSENEVKNWLNMIEILNSKGLPSFYVQYDLSIFPKENTAIAFRTGLAHRIPPYAEKNKGRYCVTGWPFATIS